MADIPVPTPEPPGPERRHAPRATRHAPRPEPTGGDFLELVKRKERGKLKLYIGSAGSAVAGFTPDLRKTETRINVALLIKL
jgi:hypothetical protein